ncbi:MAG: hypothetical protein AAGC88_11090 [Bacteroidota bacterium]
MAKVKSLKIFIIIMGLLRKVGALVFQHSKSFLSSNLSPFHVGSPLQRGISSTFGMLKIPVTGILLMVLAQPLFAQESIFKDYAEEHNKRSYCLYPSTLRMINLQENEAFDDMASSFEKFLIYELDSISASNRSFNSMLSSFKEEGFEEYLTIIGAGNYTTVLGEEKRVNEMVGVFGIENQMFAFFLRGNIAWQKIPTLVNTLSENDLFNVLDMRQWE